MAQPNIAVSSAMAIHRNTEFSLKSMKLVHAAIVMAPHHSGHCDYLQVSGRTVEGGGERRPVIVETAARPTVLRGRYDEKENDDDRQPHQTIRVRRAVLATASRRRPAA
jgi:hypothetical protein